MRAARRRTLVDRLLGRLRVVPRQRLQAHGRDRGLDGGPGAGLAAGGRRPDGLLGHAPRRHRRLAGGTRAGRGHPGRGRAAAGRRTGVIGLHDADHRPQRDGGTGLGGALVGRHHRLPRQPARARDGPGDRRGTPVRARAGDPVPAERRGCRRRVVAQARVGLGHRARGLRIGPEDLRGGLAARLARPAHLVPHGAAVVPRDQRARRQARRDARLPVGHRLCRPRRAPAHRQLARDRQARGARCEAGRGRPRCRVRLVVGLGDVRLGRCRRRQAARRVHLPVDARPRPV